MSDDDNSEQGNKPKARPLNGDGLECFNLTVQLNLVVEKNQSVLPEDSSEKAPSENLSLSAYWLENLNTPVNARIKTRFTPGTMFSDLQQSVNDMEKSPQDARVQTTLGSDIQDTH